VLGERFTGIVCSDRWGGYDYLEPTRRQLCWAHLRRDFTAHSEGMGEQKQFGNDGLQIAHDLFTAWDAYHHDRDRRPVRVRASPAESHDHPVERVNRVAVDAVLVNDQSHTSGKRLAPWLSVLACLPVALLALPAPVRAAASLPLREVARVPLSGPAVRFDYTSFDPSTKRLWIAHMDANQLLAFDVVRRRIVKTIPAPGVHGVIAVPAEGRVYVSATNAHEVLTIDARTGTILARAPAGQYPDGLAYDPVERHVFVSDESGGVETVLNAAGHHIATIPVDGEAGNVQYDTGSKHILADVQTVDQVAVIDPRTDRIVRRVHLTNCVSDHSLLIDSPHRVAFIACDGNATLLTLSLRTMKVTGTYKVGGSPDVLAFDNTKRRLYVSAESGAVGVFAEGAHSLRPLGLAFLATEAHTVAVDPTTHLVYFPLQSGSAGKPQLLIMKPT
jgi:DNA-binding beta-propeller fold protein YncE